MALFVDSRGKVVRRLSAKSFDLTEMEVEIFGYLVDLNSIALKTATTSTSVVVVMQRKTKIRQ